MKKRGSANCASRLFPALPEGRYGRIVTLVLIFAGSLGAFSWLQSPLGALVALGAAAAATLLSVVSSLRPKRPGLLLLVRVFQVLMGFVWVGWLVTAAMFGKSLAWAVPLWLMAIVCLLAVAGLAGRFGRPRVRVPATLAIGLWIAACVVGWGFEDGRTRCDDFLRVQNDPEVDVVLPAHSALLACEPGRTHRLGRYMRRVWEDPVGDRLVFTTQPGILNDVPFDPELPTELAGSICEYRTDVSALHCLGEGKSEGIAASSSGDRLFMVTWGGGGPGKRGAVYAFPTQGPFEPLAVAALDRPSVHLFHDGPTDTLGVLFDDASGMLPLRASDLTAAGELVPVPFGAGDVFYDEASGDGLICFSPSILLPWQGQAGALIAFGGRPFSPRLLVTSADHPWIWFSMVWGCQFDARAREAWAVIASLGLLLRIDYDSGHIEDTFWVGPGMRAMVLDRLRNRVYLADFLSGGVVALEAGTGARVKEWFAGRFVRGLQLSRDGRSLWVGSNLGILRIPLGNPPPLDAGDVTSSAGRNRPGCYP